MSKPKHKGGRGVLRDRNSLRNSGVRLTAVHPRCKQIVDLLAAQTGLEKSEVIERALEAFMIAVSFLNAVSDDLD